MKEQETRERNPRSYSQGGGKMRPKERSPIVVGLAVFALAIASMACGYLVTQDGQLIEQPDQAVEAFELPEAAQEAEVLQPLVVEVPEEGQAEGEAILPAQDQVAIPISGDPQVLWEFHVSDMEFQPPENGMVNLLIAFTVKNTSESWQFLGGADPFDLRCSGWIVQKATLETKEGYEYEGWIYLRSAWVSGYCLPPGAVIARVGDFSFSETTPFGLAAFKIAEGLTPETLILSFKPTEGKSLERSLSVDLSKPYSGPKPFDLSYGLTVYQAGERVEIDPVTLVTEGVDLISLTNNHEAYSILIYSESSFCLVSEAGDLSCLTGSNGSSDVSNVWRSTFRDKIGPKQTVQTPFFQDVPEGKYWLIVRLLIRIDDPSGSATIAQLVVELP